MEQRMQEDEAINDFTRAPIGEGREETVRVDCPRASCANAHRHNHREQAYNKELKTLLSQARDDVPDTAEIGENRRLGIGATVKSEKPFGGGGGGRKRLLSRISRVLRWSNGSGRFEVTTHCRYGSERYTYGTARPESFFREGEKPKITKKKIECYSAMAFLSCLSPSSSACLLTPPTESSSTFIATACISSASWIAGKSMETNCSARLPVVANAICRTDTTRFLKASLELRTA